MDAQQSAGLANRQILQDFRTAVRSREASLLGRREVLTGKAKFGIFGDGKEVAQLAMARAFRQGDIRAGYYRDQTFMMALGLLSVQEFFAQLYADTDLGREPTSGGRQMNAHFATRMVDPEGNRLDLTSRHNSSADLSPTASQMPRLVGLAYASKLYRDNPDLPATGFSDGGNEVAFGTIGNASCAEGMFWEAVNAVGVLGGPLLLSIWDDDYGISVPNRYQITREDLSLVLRGFQRDPDERRGYDIYSVCGWDYPSLCETYLRAADVVRREHVPAIVHVKEMTQPQGHSTSGSHERYKSEERLAWEAEFDCIAQMRGWMIAQNVADDAELDRVAREEKEAVRDAREEAWEAYRAPIEAERRMLLDLASALEGESSQPQEVRPLVQRLEKMQQPLRRDLMALSHDLLLATRGTSGPANRRLAEWRQTMEGDNRERYGSHLWSESPRSARRVRAVAPVYATDAPVLNGFEILNAGFDAALARVPELVAFGEDLGKLGDVNQGFSGLQEKYGEARVSDTGIRECTILGQAIGLALRGLRPIAEIQYLDYLLYALQIASDDLATVRWRSCGGQVAPVILRTRGHRLEGVWHSGSPMGALLHLLRGVCICVPRDMTRAVGFYNTLLESDDPGLVVEVLNGYRIKEKLPSNIGELTVPVGVVSRLREGADVTVLTYGACCRIALAAAEQAAGVGIEVEVIDAQSLLPFDLDGSVAASLRRTNRLIVVDEDVPGGASAYLVQQVLERDGGFDWLDAEPRTVTSAPHRPAYGSDGDYFSKPNRETIFEAIYTTMREAHPGRFPAYK